MAERSLETLVSSVQVFAGTLVDEDHANAAAKVRAFADTLTRPPDRLHNLVLSALLLDLAVHVSTHLHASAPDGDCSCRGSEAILVDAVTRWTESDPRTAFARWTDRFFEAFSRAHPDTPALAAARLIRKAPQRPWTIEALAVQASTTSRALTRQFGREFAVPLKTYLHVARLHAAVRLLAGANAKVERVAEDVGYRSKKDLYRVFRDVLGTTPATFRRLPSSTRHDIERTLTLRLLPARREPNLQRRP